MSATILPFPSGSAAHQPCDVPRTPDRVSPLQPPAATGEPRSSIADALSETALAMRIAARKLRARIKPRPLSLQMGEKVLFHWPSGTRNRESFPDAQTHPGLRSAHERRRAVALAAPDGAGNLKLTTGIVTGWVFGAADEADRRYFIQLTEGPDAGTRICLPRKGLMTVFPQGGDA